MSIEFEEDLTDKRTESYRELGQGIRVLYEHEEPEVDILAVPGLGANPEECWTWSAKGKDEHGKAKGGAAKNTSAAHNGKSTGPATRPSKSGDFNWIRDAGGLAKLYPKSRIMLYNYASAWMGAKKVRATMKDVCTLLLDDLKEKRKGGTEIIRPLLIMGHSMGGVVIAKTLTIARAKKEYEAVLTCTMGCLFFGSPFRGSSMAKVALMYSAVFGDDAYESLLSFMDAEKTDTLDEVVSDFLELCSKLVPPIDIVCVWEQVPTIVNYTERVGASMPTLLQHKFFQAGISKLLDIGLGAAGAGTHFVDQDSAVLKGHKSIMMASGHSDLIKFESITTGKFVPIKIELDRMVSEAQSSARRRTFLSGQNLMTQRFVNQIRESLEGVDMRMKYRAKEQQGLQNSWLIAEGKYQEWLRTSSKPRPSYLWLKSGPGLGKTRACLAAIKHIREEIDLQQLNIVPGSHNDRYLAFFLCEPATGCCTAEDLLKNIITQLILQEGSLAQHARSFVPNPRHTSTVEDYRAYTGAKATATVDNLWKCLNDIMDDPVVSSMHILINNAHCLESSSSTHALLAKFREHARSMESIPPAAQRVKVLITSRNEHELQKYLDAKYISAIDLEDHDEYGSKIKQARHMHAKEAVSQLKDKKNYSTDLAWFVGNSIRSQSEDETWTDVVCVLLSAKPDNGSNDLPVKRWLRQIGSQNIETLVFEAWNELLARNEDARLEIEELMRALTIAYEPPTLADLSVLTKIDVQRARVLIDRCAPIVEIGSTLEHKDKIIFSNTEFKKRLATIFNGDADHRRQYHGLLALLCFKYIKSSYASTTGARKHDLDVPGTNLKRSKTVSTRAGKESNGDNKQHSDRQAAAKSTDALCSYPIKYLFRHFSEDPDVAQVLFEADPDFWGQNSAIRAGWLADFKTLSTDLNDIESEGMTALHVAAGIGAEALVSLLVGRNKQESLYWETNDGKTALHIAAFNNQYSVVDTLLRMGADIEAGQGEIGTALHFAALKGHGSIMKLLISKGADVNAFSMKYGPVIDAAIQSGNVDTVKRIMHEDVKFDLDYTRCTPPLTLSARISTPELFRQILETGREKWLDNKKLLDQALEWASDSGHLESVRILLKFPHWYTNNTLEEALHSAARENNWAVVNELLDHTIRETKAGTRRDVQLYQVFYLGATAKIDQSTILEKIWAFTNGDIPQEVLDFSLYEAAVLQKDTTAVWLLEKCRASANAISAKPPCITQQFSIAQPFQDYWNVLNIAAKNGSVMLTKKLVQLGADLDTDTCYALQLAAAHGCVKVVQVLIEYGVQISKQMRDSAELGFIYGTALQAACDNDKPAIVELLVEHGADPNLGSTIPTFPITSATLMQKPAILILLLKAPGLDVNVTGGVERSTPLINAATYMSTEAVRWLLEHGARVNDLNAAGDSALIMAAHMGKEECVELLCTHDADVTYRSPRGLPIQVAAEARQPGCGHKLSQRMVHMIEVFRHHAPITAQTLRSRDNEITDLRAELTETQEQLSVAEMETAYQQSENKKLISERSFHGEQYESRGEMIKHMKLEQMELDNQLRGAKGQTEIANDRTKEVQALLDKEKKLSAHLRNRHKWTDLEEEKNDALQNYEKETQKSNGLQVKIKELEQQLKLHAEQLASVHADAEATRGLVKDEQQAREAVQQQLEASQEEYDNLRNEMEDQQAQIERFQAVAMQSKAEARSPPPAATNGQPGYFRRRTGSQLTGDLHGHNGETITSPGAATPDDIDSPVMVNKNEIPPALEASLSSSSQGFKTIHGTHRPSGALGGWKNDKPKRRTTTDSLYESSIKNGVAGKHSLESSSDGM